MSFSIQPSGLSVSGSISLKSHPNAALKDAQYNIRLPAGQGRTFSKVDVQGAKLVSFDEAKEMAIFKPTTAQFSFTATFKTMDANIAFV